MRPSSLVDEDGAGHGGYPGGPVDLDVRILVRLRQDVAVLGVGEVKGSILSVVSCVVSQDYILLRKRALKRLQSTECLAVQIVCFKMIRSSPGLGSPLPLGVEPQTEQEEQLAPRKHRPRWQLPSAARPHSRL